MLAKINKYILLFGIACTLLSCKEKLTYERFHTVNEQAWRYQDSLMFRVAIADSIPKKVAIAVRNTSEYEKANLWLFVKITTPAGQIIQDTLDCTLADDYGYWLGDGFSGLYLTQNRIKKANLFRQKGDWEVQVKHGMRKDAIAGVREIGLVIAEEKK